MDRILIIDDNQSVHDALSLLFELSDIESVSALTAEEGLALISAERFGAVVQDMNFTEDTTSGREGVELFHRIRDIDPDLPVILLTAWTDLETAVTLVRHGAADYISKPWDDNKLISTVQNLLEMRSLQLGARETAKRKQRSSRNLKGADLCSTVVESDSMLQSVELAVSVARADVAVLITGPNGSGKEQIAKIIQANSPRADAPFICVNMGAIPEDLMEAELFGAEAGAYTGLNKRRVGRFEAADGGTLFLDEIGNLSLEGQAKLLRVLQTGQFEPLGSHESKTVDVRIISATNADLAAEIEAKRFREDLFYRINVIEIELQGLSDRRADIEPLAKSFLDIDEIPADVSKALNYYHWPGNVRELQNACQRARILSNGRALQIDDFGLKIDVAQTAADLSETDIRSALAEAEGVVARAARNLGISRQSLYRRMEKFGMKV